MNLRLVSALLLLLGSGNAAAVTIDFESAAVGEFSSIVIDGFRFDEFPSYSDPNIIEQAPGDLAMGVSGAGSCGPFGDCGFVSVIMTRDDGGAFAYFGSDISTGCFDEVNGACSFAVIGELAGGEFAEGPVGTGDWLNLVSLRFSASGESFLSGGFQSFGITADNIVVSAVPVPAAVWLFASGLVSLGWLRRKPG